MCSQILVFILDENYIGSYDVWLNHAQAIYLNVVYISDFARFQCPQKKTNKEDFWIRPDGTLNINVPNWYEIHKFILENVLIGIDKWSDEVKGTTEIIRIWLYWMWFKNKSSILSPFVCKSTNSGRLD